MGVLIMADIMDGYDILGVKKRKILDQYNQNPFAAGLTTPGLMDSPKQEKSENPFGGLFKPPAMDFSPPPVQPDNTKPPEENSIDEYIRLMKEMYHPQTTASDRLNQLINSFPQEKKPSLGRTLVGVAAGLGGGVKASQEVMDEPYKHDLESWKAQTTPAYQAAEVERQRNDTDRTLTGNVIQAQIADKKNRITEENNREKNRIAEEKNQAQAAATKTRSEAYAFKQYHPTWVFDFKGPVTRAYNPTNPSETVNLGPSGHLSDADQINLKGEWNVKAAETRGMNATDLEALKQSGRPFNIGNDIYVFENGVLKPVGSGAITRPGTPPKEGKDKPNINAPRAGRNDILRESFDDPLVKKYKFITAPGTSGGDYQLAPAPEYGWWGDAEVTEKRKKYNEILEKLGIPLLSIKGETPSSSQELPPNQLEAPRPATRSDRYGISSRAQVSPETTKGLGPQAVPPVAAGGGGYKYQADQSNPKEQRRTRDGKMYEYSHDGGQTWGAR
jgi:hypothetical protein